MEVVKGNSKPLPKLLSAKAQLDPFQAVDLYQFIKEIQKSNPRLTETVTQWAYKNQKKLAKILSKHSPKEDAVVQEYALKDEKNKSVIFWDGHENPVEQGGKVVMGQRAILDAKTNMLLDTQTLEPVARPQVFAPYVPAEKREEYLEKKRKINSQKYEVQLEKINPELLSGVVIPSVVEQEFGKNGVIDLFYENVVNMIDTDDDVKEVEEEVVADKPADETAEVKS